MFPETFEMVLGIIGPVLRAINNVSNGRKTISEEKQLFIAIWFMATPDSYRYMMYNLLSIIYKNMTTCSI